MQISWSGNPDDAVMMTGPATTVFDGEIKIEAEGEELTFIKNEISSVRLNDADF